MSDPEQSCMTCRLLLNCKDTDYKMLRDRLSCGNWYQERRAVIRARERAYDLAGRALLEALLTQRVT